MNVIGEDDKMKKQKKRKEKKVFVWPELMEFEAKKEPIKGLLLCGPNTLNLAFNTIGIISYFTFTMLHRIIILPPL